MSHRRGRSVFAALPAKNSSVFKIKSKLPSMINKAKNAPKTFDHAKTRTEKKQNIRELRKENLSGSFCMSSLDKTNPKRRNVGNKSRTTSQTPMLKL